MATGEASVHIDRPPDEVCGAQLPRAAERVANCRDPCRGREPVRQARFARHRDPADLSVNVPGERLESRYYSVEVRGDPGSCGAPGRDAIRQQLAQIVQSGLGDRRRDEDGDVVQIL
jgi:hypothetical protein